MANNLEITLFTYGYRTIHKKASIILNHFSKFFTPSNNTPYTCTYNKYACNLPTFLALKALFCKTETLLALNNKTSFSKARHRAESNRLYKYCQVPHLWTSGNKKPNEKVCQRRNQNYLYCIHYLDFH